MALNASWLREEEVADHGDVVRCFRHVACFCIACRSLNDSFGRVDCHNKKMMVLKMQKLAMIWQAGRSSQSDEPRNERLEVSARYLRPELQGSAAGV